MTAALPEKERMYEYFLIQFSICRKWSNRFMVASKLGGKPVLVPTGSVLSPHGLISSSDSTQRRDALHISVHFGLTLRRKSGGKFLPVRSENTCRIHYLLNMFLHSEALCRSYFTRYLFDHFLQMLWKTLFEII